MKHFDRHPIPRGDAPPLSGPRPDRLDDSDGLVAGDERESACKFPGVLLMVGPAQPAGLHADKRVVVADGG